MDRWYPFVLFIHVASAMALAAALGIMTVCEFRIGAVWTLDEMRRWVGLADRCGKALGAISPLLLFSALYLVHLRWGFSQPWVVAALVVFFIMALSGRLLIGNRLYALLEATIEEGGVSPAIRRRIEDPVLRWHPWLRIGIFTWLLFLMTIKPGLELTLGTLVVALVCGGALAQLDRGSHAPVAEAAAIKGGR